MADQTTHEFKMPTPTEEHQRLQPFEGTFRGKVKVWTGPGDPFESSGTISNTFQLGGLYLHQDYEGDRTDGPFPSFCGKGYWGFNAVTGKYEGFWIDNASSVMQTETGSVDSAGKVWTMESQVPGPQSGELMQKRSVVTLIDNDHHSLEMYFTGADGNEMKSMEIQYERTDS